MAAKELRFYLDENMPVEIAKQLKSRGIDVVTVRDVGALGDSDEEHLRRATEMERVVCTNDSDFLQLASSGTEHAGMVFGQQDVHHIGAWVRYLELMTAVYTPEDMQNVVEYV